MLPQMLPDYICTEIRIHMLQAIFLIQGDSVSFCATDIQYKQQDL